MTRDNAYWQRLRKDVPSNAAAILAAVAALFATLCVMGVVLPSSYSESRASPLYLPLMLPFAWFVSGLTGFTPRYVRLWRPAMVIACLAGIAATAVALHTGEDVPIQLGGCIVTVTAAVASLIVFRESLLAREGPAR